MKNLRSLTLTAVLALCAVTINAQTITTVAVDLTSDPGTTIFNVTSGSGTITGLACKVTTAVTGSPAWGLSVQVNGGTFVSLPAAYFFSNSWAGNAGAFTSGSGSAVNDTLIFPVYIPYTTSVRVGTIPFSSAATGALKCSVLR